MEVKIAVATGTDMQVIEAEYPDIYLDETDADGCDVYFIGDSTEETIEDDAGEWLTRAEAIECCGFIEGALPGSDTLLEGNGAWAQGMLQRVDFSGYAGGTSGYEADAALWRRGFAAGTATALVYIQKARA